MCIRKKEEDVEKKEEDVEKNEERDVDKKTERRCR